MIVHPLFPQDTEKYSIEKTEPKDTKTQESQGQGRGGMRKHWDSHPFLSPGSRMSTARSMLLKRRLEDPALDKPGKNVAILTFAGSQPRMIWLITEKLMNEQTQLLKAFHWCLSMNMSRRARITKHLRRASNWTIENKIGEKRKETKLKISNNWQR